MQIKIDEINAKKRLDIFLSNILEKYSRNQISLLIENNIVLVNNKTQKNSYKLKLNDIIEFDEEKISLFLNQEETLEAYDFKLDIRYEDDDILVINKPKKMLTHPTKFDNKKTLVNALIFHCKDNLANKNSIRRGIVHRLDKNTAGLMIAVKTDFAFEEIASQIKQKTLKRKYKAIALGNFEIKEGQINKPLAHYLKDNVKMVIDEKGQEAITNYRVLEEYKGASLIELELLTGRTHQIRAHLASLNHPVFGDSLYGAKSFLRNEFYNLKTTEQLLQSYYIEFIHPKTKQKMNFELKEEEFSEDFIKILNFLRSKENEYIKY